MKTRRERVTPWDIVDYLKTEEDIEAHLLVALEDGDPQEIVMMLGEIARAKGMTKVAEQAGLGRESLYKALSPTGNPEFATIMKVIKALGFTLALSSRKT